MSNNSNPKSFGTLLRSNPLVNAQYLQLQTSLDYKPWKDQIKLPDFFDGREKWGKYLSPVRNQGKCGNCWAIASTDMLADRYSLYTLGQTPRQLSATEMTICAYDSSISDLEKAIIQTELLKNLSETTQKNSACNGNSLYTAIRYLYWGGVPSATCLTVKDRELLTDYDKFSPLPTCESLEGIYHDTCPSGELMRVYRAGHIGVINGNDSPEEDIMYDIFMRGSIAVGMTIYYDFLNNYDGKSIYIPSDTTTPIGGHAVRLIGWGSENDVNYWIAINSWGDNWGDKGYFRIKKGVCDIEQNAVSIVPDIPGIKIEIPLSSGSNSDILELRNYYQIDETTKYPYTLLDKMKEGKIQGSLVPAINTDYIPKSLFDVHKYFVAGIEVPQIPPKIPKGAPIKLHVNISVKTRSKIWIIVCVVFTIIAILSFFLSTRIQEYRTHFLVVGFCALIIAFIFSRIKSDVSGNTWSVEQSNQLRLDINKLIPDDFCIFSPDYPIVTATFRRCVVDNIRNNLSYSGYGKDTNTAVMNSKKNCLQKISGCITFTDNNQSLRGKWTDDQKKYLGLLLLEIHDKNDRTLPQCVLDCLNGNIPDMYDFQDFMGKIMDNIQLQSIIGNCLNCVKIDTKSLKNAELPTGFVLGHAGGN